MAAQTLNTLHFPLHGERLIEASAGTGKTFTIAGLYLRLLLGHGAPGADGTPTAHQRPLGVTEILVVTFTEAATAELRGRIRARIHEARLQFARRLLAEQQGTAAPLCTDPVIGPLLAEIADASEATRRLLDAERQMDEAAIFTIHGFCQRMLRQNAFESGALFASELLTDDSALVLQAVHDYWRQAFYGQSLGLASEIRSYWAGPGALLGSLRSWVGRSEVQLQPPTPAQPLQDLFNAARVRIEAVQQAWLAQVDAIRQQTENQVKLFTPEKCDKWMESISHWAQHGQGLALPDDLERYAASRLAANIKKGGSIPDLPLFAQIEALTAEPPTLKPAVIQQALHAVRARMRQARLQDNLLTFDDLLADLDRALAGPGGEVLAARIRQQFRVAMIDEFQDTDAQQYRIFTRIYGQQPETALLMIGDPKQAIYAFRGADIFTYMQARQRVSDHYTLARNFRSTCELVRVTNYLFEQAKRPFIYDEDIPFAPVAAQGKKDDLYINGAPATAMTVWLHPERPVITKGVYEDAMAAATATQIHDLLCAGQQGTVTIGDQPLQPSDIAILVRTGKEAGKVRDELARLGIASVYLSNRDSVFSQPEAHDLLLLLQACLSPGDERALRAALATALFDLDANQLDKLVDDEQMWEQTVDDFRHYQRLWQRQGVQAMLLQVIHQRELAASLLGSPNGERRLTNVLHLGELLQQASAELDGEYALVRWLSAAMAAPGEQSGDQILRLESERKLVQVVTIHKSKGLQYPLVFLPFICAYRAASEALYHQQGQTVLNLQADEAAKALAEQERLAEDLRLLYVALTRGVYATWLGLGPLKSGGKGETTELHRSAIGYLLQQGEEGDAARLAQALAAWQAIGNVAVEDPPARLAASAYQVQATRQGAAQVRQFQARLERNWWISSYSALSAQGDHHARGVLAMPGFDAEAGRSSATGDSAEQVEMNMFTFPRGAVPGTLLHSLFETMDFTAVHAGEPAALAALDEAVSRQLAAHGYDAGWLPVLVAQVRAVLATELSAGLCLGQIPAAQRQAELEFLLPMADLDAAALSRVLARHDPLSARAPALTFQTVRGMLKGFIDLVFCWQGRWYVLDYKSNHLGNAASAYHPDALAQAMIQHRYDLQYQLYVLALHRLLRQRLPDYDPARHLGGVFYLFLRGMPEGGVFHATPSVALVQDLDRLFEGGADAQ